MTKFEEEVKRPKKAYIDPFSKRDVDFTGVAKKFTEGAQTLKEWKEYASLLEQNAELTQENNIVNQIDSQLAKENEDLKSQLQQQALPVVPEFVAEFIDECKKEGDCLFGIFADATSVEHDMPDLVYFWLGDEGNNDELFARAWLDGYQVEKPQLFYLKNKLTIMYLYKKALGGYGEDPSSSIKYLTDDFKFTQQEIDSMKTGSYEIVPVEDGE